MLRKLWGDFLQIMYPNVCVLCGDVLAFGDERGICDKCEEVYPYLREDLCTFCGKPLIDLSDDRCFDCRKKVHYYVEGHGIWSYEDFVKDAIHDYKYKNHKENGRLFAKELVRYYNDIRPWPIHLVIPVPLHKKRLKERGFDQTRIIAGYFCEKIGYELGDESILRRRKPTKPQKTLTDQEREVNVADAFVVTKDGIIKGKNILLIDDIYTTGATIDSCAKALLEGGAKSVYYLSIAVGRGL